MRELDRRAGLSPGYTWLLESGSRSPKLDTICAMARALGVSVDGLITAVAA